MTSHDHTQQQRRRSVGTRTFSPAQAVAGILGLVLLIVGGVAMARVGFDSLTGETATVLGLDHTLLLAIIHIVAGLLFLGAASRVFGSRSQLIGLGVALVAFGAVVLIEPSPFIDYLGEGRPVGAAHLILGAISLITGITADTVVTTESVVTDEEYVDERHLD